MKKRVLIVDNEIETFARLPETLEEYGYGVVAVDRGENAVKLARMSFYDLILIDFNLPDISGFETLSRIKKVSPLSLVIMMTSAAPESLIKKAAEEGSFAVLHKPFKIDAVMEQIDEAMGKITAVIVDAHPEEREALKNHLEQKGCKCVSLGDGRDALEILKHDRPNVIFADVKMDAGNADALTIEKIKAVCPDVDVIMLASSVKDEYIEMALKMGAITCLAKPVEHKNVSAAIERTMQRMRDREGMASVLIVEDDPSVSKTLHDILEDNNYDVVSAKNGAQAVAESAKKAFSAAVVDFRLPDISGLDLIRKIKGINAQMTVILMTAYENMDMAIAAIKEGVDDFLVKPVEPQVFLRSLRKGLRKQG